MNTRYTLFNDTYVMYQLLEFIDENSIIVFCKTSKKLNEICEQYIEMEDDKRFEIIMHEEILRKYCINNNLIKIKKVIGTDLNSNYGLILDWNYGLYGACKGGHIEIIKLMIKKGATRLDGGLYSACEGGNLDIVKLMIEKGAMWWDHGLVYACIGGNMDIVKLMIEKGATRLNCGLYSACVNGHINIVKLMIEKGATRCGYCNKSMEKHLSKSEKRYQIIINKWIMDTSSLKIHM